MHDRIRKRFLAGQSVIESITIEFKNGDALFGPISTFSMWASFYGDVPIRFVFDAEEPLDLALAEPVIGWNRLADGTELSLPDEIAKRFATWNPAVS